MSLHYYQEHWQVWLLDKNLVPQHRLTQFKGFKLDWKLRDDVSWSATMPVMAEQYSYIDPDVDQFLYVSRTAADVTRAQVVAIEDIDVKWKPLEGRKTLAADMSGTGGALFFLGRNIVQNDPAGTASAWGQVISNASADDMIKDIIRYQLADDTAYADPDARTRYVPGLTVAANKSEAPAPGEDWQRQGSLWTIVHDLCLKHDIDITLTPTWNGPDAAITLEFDTHYQGRGSANGVVLADTYRVLTDSSWYRSKSGRKTAAYTKDLSAVVVSDDYDNHMRAEMIVDSLETEYADIALRDAGESIGHKIGFRETQGVQLGVDFWLGDTVSHFDSELNTIVESDYLSGVEITIQQDKLGSELIALTMGDEKPTQTNKSGGKGKGRPYDPVGDGVNAEALYIVTPDTNEVPPVASKWTFTGDNVTITGTPATGSVGFAIPGYVTPSILFGAAYAEGTANTFIRSDATLKLVFAGDSGTAVPDASNTLTIAGSGGIVTAADTNTVTVDGSAFSQTGHTHAHEDLTDVTADQHHLGFIGLLGDTGAGATPDANDKITLHGATGGYAFNAHDNQVDLTGPWTRFDAGSADYALRQTTYADDVRIQSAASTDVIWLEGDTGKSHFADDMYVGNAAGVSPARLTIYDASPRAFSGLFAQYAAVGYSVFKTIDSGITVIDNQAGASISFQLGGTEAMHIHGDLELISIRNAVDLVGATDADGSLVKWRLDSTTGDFALYVSGTTTFGDYIYTWPTTGADQYDVLGIASITSNEVTLGWLQGIYGTPGTLTATTTNVAGDGHTHAITASASPGANTLVKTDGSGYITLTAGRLNLVDSAAYLHQTGTQLVIQTDNSRINLAPGGAGEVYVEQGVMRPQDDNVTALGSSSYRYSDEYLYGKLYLGSTTNNYITSAYTNQITLVGATYVSMHVSTTEILMSSAAFYPYSGSPTLGTLAKPFGTTYTSAVYLSAYGTKTGPFNPGGNATCCDSPTGTGTAYKVLCQDGNYRYLYARTQYSHSHPLV